MPEAAVDNPKNEKNLKKIEELYSDLNICFTATGCDHVKATSILNSIIERKKFLTTTPKISRYVDLKRMISHYIKSADQKGCHYDEINVSQIGKKIQEFEPEQSLYLYEVFKRTLVREGYPKKAEELGKAVDIAKLKAYSTQNGLKPCLKWLSIRCSYRTRYLIYMIIGTFIFLNLILLPSHSIVLFRFTTLHISDIPFFDHLGNVLMYIFDLSDNVKVEPLNFMGVLMMFIGKSVFVLFIVNFLLKKILDKILR